MEQFMEMDEHNNIDEEEIGKERTLGRIRHNI